MSLGAVIWVSGTEQLGLLRSHQPYTLAILVPLVEQEYNQEEPNCVPCLFMCMSQTLFGEFLVSLTSVV